MKPSDLKQIIEFMYRGEVKVLETELDSLLAVAESLQVKGLSSVRNTCNKETVQSTSEKIEQKEENDNDNNNDDIPRGTKRKKTKSDSDSNAKEEISDDESLASSVSFFFIRGCL